ncbi:hypothetical protein FNO01nite_29550 [Flavobacterium noncentrifugens]|nr:hypothetical protein FNO01nite_29550 [Flavobacterium noncentrifugens]
MNLAIIFQAAHVPEIDHKIRYSELLNWSTTLVVGFFVGYVLKNQSDNDKVVKGYLLDDVKTISKLVEDLKDYCYSFKPNHSFTDEQRKDIDAKINVLDKKITLFCNFLKDCYTTKHNAVNDILVTQHNSLNRIITGIGYYDKDCEDEYFDKIVAEASKFESELRRLYLRIIKEM